MKASIGVSRQSRGDVAFQWLINAIAMLIGLVTLYPLIYTLSASLSEPLHIMRGDVVLFPVGFTLDSYRRVFASANILNGYKNTLIYAFSGTAINLILTIMAAYPLSLPDLRGKSFFTFMITFTMFFSGGLIPSFINVRNLGLMNTVWAVLLPGAINATNMLIMRNYFIHSIPGELREAASIDGCSPLRTMTSIILPLSKTVLAVMAINTFMSSWNDFFWPFLITKDPAMYTIQVGLKQFKFANETLFAPMMAGATISALPMFVMFFALQKYFMEGVTIGAVKG